MRIDVPSLAVDLGFVNDPLGTHTSRTMMLTELRALLESAGPDATYADYQDATIRENACGKATLSTRSKTFRHLRELYALEPGVPLFYALRLLWQSDPTAQPLLAALCAAARDPMLRTTIELILALAPGEGPPPPSLLRPYRTPSPAITALASQRARVETSHRAGNRRVCWRVGHTKPGPIPVPGRPSSHMPCSSDTCAGHGGTSCSLRHGCD